MSGIQNGLIACYAAGGNDSYTKLLLHCDGTNGSTTFTDSSTAAHVFTAGGNAQLSTTSPKFGTASLLFDGSGDYAFADTATDFTFGTGDFTIDFWANPTNFADNRIMYEGRPAGLNGFYPVIYAEITTGSLKYFLNSANAISGSALTAGTFSHIALTRSGTSTRLFINGVQTGATYSDSNTYLGGANRPLLGIGNDVTTGPFIGKLDEIRVSKGIARWTSTFVPPTSQYF